MKMKNCCCIPYNSALDILETIHQCNKIYPKITDIKIFDNMFDDNNHNFSSSEILSKQTFEQSNF